MGGETVIGAGSVIGENVWLTHSVPLGVTVMIETPNFKYKEEIGKTRETLKIQT